MADWDQLNQALASDPEWQQIQAMPYHGAMKDATGTSPIDRFLAQRGLPSTQEIQAQGGWISKGQVSKEPNKFLTTALPLMGAVAGGIGALGGFGNLGGWVGGSAANAGPGAAGQVLDSEGNLANVGGVAGDEFGGYSGQGMGHGYGGGLPDWLKPKLGPTLLNMGMRGLTGFLGARAAGKASEQQQAGLQKALDLQKEVYGQQRQALMPYYQVGAGSLGRLGSFLGTPMAPALPAGPLSSLGGK